MDYTQEYKQKLVSADEAVKVIKSGDWVDYGWCTGTPDALDKALSLIHIYRLAPLHPIAVAYKILQVPCLGDWIAGNIDHTLWRKL